MRAQGLPLNTIVLGAVAVLVLVVIAVAVVPSIGGIFGSIDVGVSADLDTCQHYCEMLISSKSYAYQAGPSQYCDSGCVGVVQCIINGETVSTTNCAGECDSAGDCPPDTCTIFKVCLVSPCQVDGSCGFELCTGTRRNCDFSGWCEVDIDSDVNNCGDCGNVCPGCPGSRVCNSGVCGCT